MAKSKEEIDAVILKLQNKKISLPETELNGVKNWAVIDKQIHVLRYNINLNQIDVLADGELEGFKIKLLEARDWLDGKIEEWQLLA